MSIERLMDAVTWTAHECPEGPTGLPFVTHSGELRIGDFVFRCYQLSNGQRVLDEDDLAGFFGSCKP